MLYTIISCTCIYLLQSNNVVFIVKHVNVNKVDDVTAKKKEQGRGGGV